MPAWPTPGYPVASVHTIADNFAAEVANLCATTTVTEKQWQSSWTSL